MHLVLVPVIGIANLKKDPMINIEDQAYIGAVAAFALVTKNFDWLRIHDKTAFYILLIQRTIIDILPFLILLLVALTMFAMPQRVLSTIEQSDPDPWDEDSPRIWGFGLGNSLL